MLSREAVVNSAPSAFLSPSPFLFLFFVCSRGVEDKGVFNSQRFYLRICPSPTCHLSSKQKQSNLSIQRPPLIYFQMFFKTSALDLLPPPPLRSLSTCGGLSPAGKGPCEVLCELWCRWVRFPKACVVQTEAVKMQPGL